VIADHNGLLLEQLASPSCLPWRRSSNQQAAAAAAHGGITGAGKLQYGECVCKHARAAGVTSRQV
jgi:hypothetical protein